MSAPFLSVIIPVYNVEAYLEENLESLTHQTVSDYELILVNDGSTDSSLSIIERYAEEYPFIKVVNKKNGGISSARNTGISEASGEYLGFIDSDDFVKNDYVESMIRKAKEDDSDIVVCDLVTWFGDNDQRNYIMKGLREDLDELPNDRRLFLSPLFAWNKIYRRSFFLEQDILYEEGTWYEDLEVTLYLAARAKKISYVEKILICYRQRENSIMSSRNQKCLDIFHVLEAIYDRFERNGLLQEYKEELEYLFIENLLVYGGFRLLALDNYQEVFKRAKLFLKKYFPDYKKNSHIQKLPLKYRLFIFLNDPLLLPLYRSYLLRK
ncbi:MAG: glycosyltransferase [Erysipelotrichaceae bacterium]|nr:glycosyltransferase [Erysipelotrichaceae bacterium]